MACTEKNYWFTATQRPEQKHFARGRRRAPSVPRRVRDAAATVAQLGPDFTGRHGVGYYYLGQKWTGPTNMIGHKGAR